MRGVAVRSIAALEVARVLIRPWFTLAVHVHVVNRAIAASRMAIRRAAFFGWHSTTSRARKLRPGTVKPWSSLIARARKSGVDSPGPVAHPDGMAFVCPTLPTDNRMIPAHSAHGIGSPSQDFSACIQRYLPKMYDR
ncbi:MAG: hypothetical protein QOJ56_5067 [Mycobacterium sp.]|jgi:hypothetical protein|nr:hypothetical protein [Mycobacterium sp.]